jgi:hypothetical protein
VRRAVDEVRRRGHELVLLEAGPHVVGSMLGEGLVDELFLTVSPLLAGRSTGELNPRAGRGREPAPLSPSRGASPPRSRARQPPLPRPPARARQLRRKRTRGQW